jgi:hypothetical protein
VRAGVTGAQDAPPMFAPWTEQTQGNNLPGWSGSHSGPPDRPGPGPAAGGQLGDYDPFSGADPSRPNITAPYFLPGPDPAGLDTGIQNNPSYWRGGLQGFNDQQQIRDRHAYYDRGTQRTGLARSVPGNPPNYHSDGPARPDLRTVNRSVNPQIGSDNTANQDDLNRPYTWLGQQDGTISPVYGGVPGMWVPYGTRGGIPYAIQSPVAEGAPADGPAMVWSGPPHGLHSDTIQSGRQIIERYMSTPQMRPVRFDRPSNSPIAGQSYSQTVQMQGAPQTAGQPRGGPGVGLSFHVGGRGWIGG